MQQSHDFLKLSTLMWSSDDVIEIRPLPVDKGRRMWIPAKDIPHVIAELTRHNEDGANLYFGVLPRRSGGGKKEDCLAGLAVWADIDDGCSPRDAWLRAKTNGLPEPSVVINSGHGTHLYWLLKDKVDPAAISSLVADISVVLGSDPSVKDVARIMRIPGFTNWKEPVAKASLVYVGNARYSFVDLRAVVALPPVVEAPITQGYVSVMSETYEAKFTRAEKYLASVPGTGRGGRTTTAYRLAATLVRDYRLADNDAIALLKEWDYSANTPPIQGDKAYAANELELIIKHAHSFGNKQYGSKEEPMQIKVKQPEAVIQTPASCKVDGLFGEIDLQEQGKRNSIPIRWKHLQYLSRPLRPGSVVVVSGPIKVGKSFFLMNMAIDCQDAGVPWFYIPLEDDWNDFAFRVLACLESDYDMTDDDVEGADRRRDALVKHGPALEAIMARVSENPRIGNKDASGNTVIPKVTFNTVLRFVREALKKSRVVFIDPLSQIEAEGERRHVEEESFIRTLLALAKDANSTIVLSSHTNKRPGNSQMAGLSAEDVQGSASITRLVHTVIILDGHEVIEKEIRTQAGVRMMQSFNRTLTIGAARNGSGTRMKMAFTQQAVGPVFEEHGVLVTPK
jgi:KaiC/GvpD/RAD55 family RecA-like ATPase